MPGDQVFDMSVAQAGQVAIEIVEESARTYADTAQTNEGHPLAEADCS